MKGVFAVYKPVGMKSHDVVDLVRKQTGIRRVGHGGTLDPLAEGVLVIAVGRQNTKKLNEYVKGEKEYIAEIKLGQTSTTDDEEGEKTLRPFDLTQRRQAQGKPAPSEKLIKQTLKKFVGKIEQIPPIYSSIKIKGSPAHRRVRRGQKIKLEPRIVQIKKIELISYDYPVMKIKAQTGPGVYIRSLARDIGKNLNTGAYLSGLIRTRVGKFKVENALNLKKIKF